MTQWEIAPRISVEFNKGKGKRLKQTLVVVGLMDRQKRLLEQKFPGVRFRFVGIHGSGTMKGGDHVFLMLKFLRHAEICTVRDDYSDKSVHRIWGGTTSLIKAISEAVGG